MGSKFSLAEREERKISTIHHGAYVKVINEVDPKDYKCIYTATGKRKIEDLVADYRRLIRLIEVSDKTGEKLTLIEKCICFIMSLKNNKAFFLNGDVKKGSKLSTINERMIVEAAMYFLTCSNYRVTDNHDKTIVSGHFDLTGYDDNHKRELNIYKKALLDLIKDLKFDENAAVEILNRIYLRGILYKEGLSLDLEEKIKNRISCTEVMENPIIDETLSPEFMEYKRRFRI